MSRESIDVQRSNFWKDAIFKEKRVKLNWLATYDVERRKEMQERKVDLENKLSKMSITADIANDQVGPLTTESQEVGSTVLGHKRDVTKFNRFESLTNFDNQAKLSRDFVLLEKKCRLIFGYTHDQTQTSMVK